MLRGPDASARFLGSDAFKPHCPLFLGQGTLSYSEMAANFKALICQSEFRFSDFASRVI